MIEQPNSSEAKIAFYSSGMQEDYFGWSDASDMSPEELAVLFQERFPKVASESRGKDSEYINWYRNMVEHSQPDGLPSTFTSARGVGEMLEDHLAILNNGNPGSLPLPPPGTLVLPCPEPKVSLMQRVLQFFRGSK